MSRLRGAIRVGIAHWAFGNLYEEVVRMPERVAERPGPAGSPLGPVRSPSRPDP
ncbi:hypothetical protein [Pseudonocardia endophytica]|uniref:Uncharacterized protein n=1 Tax=Pseudonocardia endophytica TaxID=401976 RepID=A0A4R1HJQ7_PSEEN|nr:hypothetical protein [Pseudonocardia endophytica]TCK22567.1 hypothetical protein EV378_6573 [Pseudonocardia endophytica]